MLFCLRTAGLRTHAQSMSQDATEYRFVSSIAGAAPHKTLQPKWLDGFQAFRGFLRLEDGTSSVRLFGAGAATCFALGFEAAFAPGFPAAGFGFGFGLVAGLFLQSILGKLELTRSFCKQA